MNRTIHHFEDEPELIRWIPSALLNRYWLEHPDWIRGDGSFVEDGDARLTRFSLWPSDTEAVISYRVYRNPAEFELEFARCAVSGDIVILDLMAINDETGEMTPYGLGAWRTAAAIVGAERVVFLTAFPQRLLRDTVAEDTRIIAKPPDADTLITMLIDMLVV